MKSSSEAPTSPLTNAGACSSHFPHSSPTNDDDDDETDDEGVDWGDEQDQQASQDWSMREFQSSSTPQTPEQGGFMFPGSGKIKAKDKRSEPTVAALVQPTDD